MHGQQSFPKIARGGYKSCCSSQTVSACKIRSSYMRRLDFSGLRCWACQNARSVRECNQKGTTQRCPGQTSKVASYFYFLVDIWSVVMWKKTLHRRYDLDRKSCILRISTVAYRVHRVRDTHGSVFFFRTHSSWCVLAKCTNPTDEVTSDYKGHPPFGLTMYRTELTLPPIVKWNIQSPPSLSTFSKYGKWSLLCCFRSVIRIDAPQGILSRCTSNYGNTARNQPCDFLPHIVIDKTNQTIRMIAHYIRNHRRHVTS